MAIKHTAVSYYGFNYAEHAEKDFIEMAAARYEQNEAFFVKLFSEPEMMKQISETLAPLIYERLKRRKEI